MATKFPGPAGRSSLRRLGRSLHTVATDDNVDLSCLGLAALVFTVLGAVGIANATVLSSVIMGALAFLAVSQIRSRNQVARLDRSTASDALDLLSDEFPQGLRERARASGEYLFIGRSMGRSSLNEMNVLRTILGRGGTVRVAVMDPTDTALMEIAGRDKHATFKSLEVRIHQTLENLEPPQQPGGTLEIRVLRIVPHIGITAVDPRGHAGLICIQNYEFAPAAEPGPIMRFRPSDARWYQHFADEAERLWRSAHDWPLAVVTST